MSLDLRKDPLGEDGERPGDAEAAVSVAVSDPKTGGAAAFLRTLRRDGIWALLLTALIGFGAVSFLAQKAKPTYKAEALFYVAPSPPRLAYLNEEWRADSTVGYYNDYLRSLSRMASSYEVAKEAQQELVEERVHWWPEGVPAEEAPMVLKARLEVGELRETHLLAIAFSDADAAVVAPVVRAAGAAFARRVAAWEKQKDQVRITQLEREKVRIGRELGEIRTRLVALADELGSLLIDHRQNPVFERLRSLQDAQGKALAAQLLARTELEVARKRHEDALRPPPDGEVEAATDLDDPLTDARVMLARLRRETESVIGDLSERHPQRAQAERRLSEARRRVEELEERTRTRIRNRMQAERVAVARRLLMEKETASDAADRGLERLSERIAACDRALATTTRKLLEVRRLQGLQGKLLEADGRVAARLEELRVELQAPSRVSLWSEARTPSKPDKDRSGLFRIAGMMAGLGSGAAFLLLRHKMRGARA